MSSKASEILGVSDRRPPSSRRRYASHRDGAGSQSSRPSTGQTFNAPDVPYDAQSYTSSVKHARGDRNRLQRSDRPNAPPSKPSMDSMQPSVRFADSDTTPRASFSTARTAPSYDTALPEVSRRPAPSAWKGFNTQGNTTWNPLIGPSQESLASRRRQEAVEPSIRNSRSWFSRFTSRSSRSEVSTSRTPTTNIPKTRLPRDSTFSSTANTATATPRAVSPVKPATKIPEDMNEPRVAATNYRPRPPQTKRLNSRMPPEIPDIKTKSSARNRFGETDDLDSDDTKQPSQISSFNTLYSGSRTSTYTDFQLKSQLPAQPSRLYRTQVPLSSLIDSRSDRQSLMTTQTQPQPAQTKSLRSGQNLRVPTSVLPSSNSILSLSDSDEEEILYSRQAVDVQRPFRGYEHNVGIARPSNGPRNEARTAAVLTIPRNKSNVASSYKSPAAILSVLTIDDKRDESIEGNPLPSPMDSGSNLRNSPTSTVSNGRSLRSDTPQVPNFSVPRNGNYAVRGSKATQAALAVPHPKSPTEGDVKRQISAMSASLGGKIETEPPVPTPGNLIMASISPEEAALLTHIRRQRAQALQQLQLEQSCSTTNLPSDEPPLQEVQVLPEPESEEALPVVGSADSEGEAKEVDPVPETTGDDQKAQSEETQQAPNKESPERQSEPPSEKQLYIPAKELIDSEIATATSEREKADTALGVLSDSGTLDRSQQTIIADGTDKISQGANTTDATNRSEIAPEPSIIKPESVPPPTTLPLEDSNQRPVLRPRQPSVQYLEARSKFEQSSTSPSRSSMLPVPSNNSSDLSLRQGTPINSNRLSREISHIPRLRDTNAITSQSPFQPKRPEVRGQRETSGFDQRESSAGQTSLQEEYASSPGGEVIGNFPQPRSILKIGIAEYTADEPNSPAQTYWSNTSTSANSTTDHSAAPSDPNSADDGDDEMASPNTTFAKSQLRKGTGTNGAKYVLDAWQALGGGKGLT